MTQVDNALGTVRPCVCLSVCGGFQALLFGGKGDQYKSDMCVWKQRAYVDNLAIAVGWFLLNGAVVSYMLKHLDSLRKDRWFGVVFLIAEWIYSER